MKKLRIIRPCALTALMLSAASSASAQLLTVPQPIWESLPANERAALSQRATVNVLPSEAFGTILDAQVLNESSAATTAGSELGAQIGRAAYVDNAFRGSPRNWNYSATGNLSAQIAGALIGSMMDKPAQPRFRTRYTVRKGDGNVEYIEEIRVDPLRHPVGLCVTLSPIRPTNTEICQLTREQLLTKLAVFARTPDASPTPTSSAAPAIPQNVPFEIVNLGPPPQEVKAPAATLAKPAQGRTAAAAAPEVAHAAQQSVPSADANLVRCRFGMAAPVNAPKASCDAAGGIVLP